MLGMRKLCRSLIVSPQLKKLTDSHEIPLSHHFLAQRASNRFLDIYKLGNKDAIQKERARLADEMNRGYFADISELNKHGGKIALANKIIIPATTAVKFPSLEVNFFDGRVEKLPIGTAESDSVADIEKPPIPKASLVCLSFRANSESMIESWSLPFLDKFRCSSDVRLYEVSLIDSWLLCRTPIKQLILLLMRRSKDDRASDALKRQIVYSFGDHYYFRKELNILNLLSGYIFLLDKFGRVRWQGFGSATQEELASLVSCASILLEEK